MFQAFGEWARAIRFGRGWMSGRFDVEEVDTVVDRGIDTVPGTLFLPRAGGRALPGWVVLHGITRPGRAHPQLLRFARSLASTPAVVLVPEIPEWRELQLAPDSAVPTIKAAVLALDARPETAPGRIGLLGFSFGAPQAIVASTDPVLDGHLAGVVGFGGYCDMERTVRFQFTGRHEWKGRQQVLAPDPYGRWVVGANYLTQVPGLEDAGEVQQALWRLAAEAGDRGIPAASPVYDELKDSERHGIAPRHRELYDLFAPPAGSLGDPDAAEPVAVGLAAAARRASPAVDPRPYLDRVRLPVRLLHGLQDELIPYTETLRLKESFPPGADVDAFVTGLFAHSKPGGTSRLQFAGEALRFLDGFRRAMSPV